MKYSEIEPGMLLKDYGLVVEKRKGVDEEVDLLVYLDWNDAYSGTLACMADVLEDFEEAEYRGSPEWLEVVKRVIEERLERARDCASDVQLLKVWQAEWSAGPPAMPRILEPEDGQ